MSVMYHDGNRQLQDRFDSRRISDKLEESSPARHSPPTTRHSSRGAAYFFLATADAEGGPIARSRAACRVSYASPDRPSWRFPTMTATACSRVWATYVAIQTSGLLFIAMHDKPKRLRVNGGASVSDTDSLLRDGRRAAHRADRRARIFPNCPRYIPAMQIAGPSIYTPKPEAIRPNPSGKLLTTSRVACIRVSQPGRANHAKRTVRFSQCQRRELGALLDRPLDEPRVSRCSRTASPAARTSAPPSGSPGGLAAQGIAVLRFDFTGLGESEGEFANTHFSSNVGDLVAAADHLRETHAARRC